MSSNLFFFTSPIGLGHAARDIVIASKLDATMTFVSGQPASRLISDYGFLVKDLYKYRGFKVDESGRLKYRSIWLMKYWLFYKRCKDVSRHLINDEKTKVVIADEDFAATSIAQENSIPNVMITDFFETSFTKGKLFSPIEKKMNKVMKNIISKSTQVIIPSYGEDHDNFAFVGPIVRELSSSRDELRKQFGFDRKTILVTIGGTDAGLFLIDKAIEAFNAINKRIDAEMIIASGPSVNVELSGIRNIGYVKNLHEMVSACDLLISLAGRSTTDEAEVYGTPGIFIPIKYHFEQEDNAKRHGYSFADIYRLKDLIPLKLDSSRKRVKTTNGLAKTTALVSKLMK